MACFIAPAVEAVVVNVLRKKAVAKEAADACGDGSAESIAKIPLSRKLAWLQKMLWGGVFLLAIEHIWHGEVVLWPPFLTAMNDPADFREMLQELATVGTAMTLFVTAVWYVGTLAADILYRKKHVPEQPVTGQN